MRFLKSLFLTLFTLSLISGNCQYKNAMPPAKNASILPGAYSFNEYLPLLRGKKVGLVANQTSVLNGTHLVDTLLLLKINITKIFSPEHGFRGDTPDGKQISNSNDPKTGINIISLYGSHKKPSPSDLQQVDIVVFDIQDVGARFYTYISTLTYVMEACADNDIPLLVLDRPNPNGYYVDGPVLEQAYSSFIGLHAVPIVYGMTIGEYAAMVNGEKWIKSPHACTLIVVKCKNYAHTSRYQLPVNPSPNLPDMKAVYLYPSLCLFEGTVVSVGRGTPYPFHVFGHPDCTTGNFRFTPEPIKGVSEDPPLRGKLCRGENVSHSANEIKQNGKVELKWLLAMYKNIGSSSGFFTAYFDKLAGTKSLREQIIAGKTESEIRKSWQPGIEAFKKIRKKYLLYPDFE